jgi:RimJ/RimL family protein N-acetyltransferase
MPQPALITDRLILRVYEEADWAAAHEYGGDAETSQYQAWGPNTEDETRQFIQRCIEGSEQPKEKGYFYAIALKADRAMIGGCNLCYTDRVNREAMIGYTLSRRYWNQGYTTEAAAALLRFGFEDLGLHRIISWCTPENIGSWRVMEKIGMSREGQEHEAAWFKGKWHDWVRYAILDREWKHSQGV